MRSRKEAILDANLQESEPQAKLGGCFGNHLANSFPTTHCFLYPMSKLPLQKKHLIYVHCKSKVTRSRAITWWSSV
ncbi:hypothetical protein CJ030_MR1G006191 [Morella rubra]|uniref:Uncharacterized protein n=1 Tax=Morella rubra TaxID=262757 RepID=A0A6A1WKC9_9ROSI|nr:hypothetical protein CJ030_MR1G006191 [Morella rubra]